MLHLLGLARKGGNLALGEAPVKEALERGRVSQSRYENYVLMYEELKSRRRY